MATSASFTPKQCLPFTGELLDELQGNNSVKIAERLLPMLPPLTADSHVLDTGCGTGAASQCVAAMNSPSGLKISANDTNDMLLSAYKATAAAKSWPVAAVENMDTAKLSFPDASFSHILANFVFMNWPRNDDVVAGQMLRMLRSDGVVAATIWEEQPHAVALMTTNKKLRGENTPELPFFNTEWYGGKHIREAMLKAGFAADKIRSERMEIWWDLKDMRHWADIAWSYLGRPADGWSAKDEEDWDKAIDSIVDILKSADWYKEGEGIHYVGTAVIGQK